MATASATKFCLRFSGCHRHGGSPSDFSLYSSVCCRMSLGWQRDFFRLLVALALGLSFYTNARAGLLQELYRGFVADGNASVFIAFERETLEPRMGTGGKRIKLSSGALVEVQVEDQKDFIAFGRRDGGFILAFSKNGPVTDPENLLAADELNGFDGVAYWTLALDSPMEVRPATTAQHGQLPTVLSFNPLTIIPIEESFRGQGQFQSDIKLAVIRGLQAECLSVIQFGFTGELENSPQVEGSKLVLKGTQTQTTRAELEGPTTEPTRVRYHTSGSAEVAALLDYRTDTLTITRSAKKKTSFEARYRLLAFESQFLPQRSAPFSWHTYKGEARNVIGMLVTNGATVQLDFNDAKTYQAGRLLVEARPTQQRSRSKVVLYSLFALVTAVALILVKRLKHEPLTERKLQ